MSQLYGQLKQIDGTTLWKPIEAVPRSDGTYAIRVDTELVLDSGEVSIGNIKVGSTNQSTANLRYIKTLDDGTVVITDLDDILDSYHGARAQDAGAFPHYFGLVNEDEDWVIIEETRVSNVSTYLYTSGSLNFETNWNNRATLIYKEFYNEF